MKNIFFLFLLCIYLPSAAEIARVTPDTLKLKQLDDKAWELLNSNPDSAIIVANQLLEFAQQVKNLLYQAYSYNTTGVAYDIKGNYEEALKWYQKSLDVYTEMKDDRGIAVSMINIGIIYYYQGLYRKAMSYYQKSLKLYEKTKDERGIADAYNNISIIYKTQNQFEDALEYLEKCLAIFKKIKDEQGVLVTYTNMGLVYRLMKDYKSALKFHLMAQEIALRINDQISLAGTYIHIGFLQQEGKKFDEALANYNKALTIYREAGNLSGTADALNNIGSCYNRQNKTTEAIRFCSEGYEIAERIKALDGYSNNCYCLYEAYVKKGNDREALKYYREYVEAKDTLVNEKTAKEIAQIKFQYKYRQKELADSIRNVEKDKLVKIEKEAREAELENQKQRNYFLLIGVFVLIIFAWFMFNRFRVTQKQKIIIEKQKSEVEYQKSVVDEKNKNITDSINYALRIQKSFLPKHEELLKYFPEHFLIYQPKDIVSGDFFWCTVADNNPDLLVFALADCTGHGVPGAMMTMIGNTLLNQTIDNPAINSPAQALDFLNKELPKNLKKENQQVSIRDGMDMAMIEIDRKKMKLYFAGANNGIVIIRHDSCIELKGDKQAISASEDAEKKNFTHHEIELQKGDYICLWTDGMPDQFGGKEGKKYKSAKLRNFLVQHYRMNTSDLETALRKELNSWMQPESGREFEQIDDITITGIRV